MVMPVATWAEFNMGYNGTENFAAGRRFGFFPAVSAGWVVSEEPFSHVNNGLPKRFFLYHLRINRVS